VGAFEIPAEGVAGGRRGDHQEDVVPQRAGDHQEDVVPQRAGGHQVDVVQQQAGDHQEGVVQQRAVVLVVEVVLPLLVAVQVREGEARGAAVQVGNGRTGAIATEKALEVTTGDFGGGRPSLGWASTWRRVPATRRPSSSRERAITIGAVFTMFRRVPVM